MLQSSDSWNGKEMESFVASSRRRTNRSAPGERPGGGLFQPRQFRMQVLEKKGSKPSKLLSPGFPAGFATTCQP